MLAVYEEEGQRLYLDAPIGNAGERMEVAEFGIKTHYVNKPQDFISILGKACKENVVGSTTFHESQSLSIRLMAVFHQRRET